MYLKFDFHSHILPENWPNLAQRCGYTGWISMKHTDDGKALMMKDDGTVFRPVDHKVWSTSVRLKDMEDTGVTVQVLSTVPVMFSYWAKPNDTAYLCRLLNNHLASVVRSNPTKFVGLGTIPMQSPIHAVEEMKRCKMDLKLNGLIIGSHVNELGLDDPMFYPIWKAAEELDFPLFLHPWDMQMSGRFSKYWLPYIVGMPAETSGAVLAMIFSGVLERFPKLRIALAHGSGMLPYIIGRAEHGFHVYPADFKDNPFPPSKYMGRIFCDSLVHSEGALNLALNTFGEDSIFLGSDYPFLLGEHIPGLMIEKSQHLSDCLKKKLLSENVCKFLDIDVNRYSI
ncbi:unnamed protein product [Medioppia subpectinata]|uniref:2-amino-3-carboxymuconate-6-semialdehyde decarboxylase n=1 Tax=Medioppia subpectinata TaxID=1979941 RepID=A0A7R9PTD0_9ACAR|nr:unnamed protein product [Medioppia subpectinata]CAG2100503.1 unnamed protein product [Medioppia subpectinata]